MNVTFLDVLDRAHDGPYCEEKEWDMKVIPGAIAKILKKYDLKGTYDRENPINCDDSLVDRFWEAGLELAGDVGWLCTSTQRIMKFSREELLGRLQEAPGDWHVGFGKDARDWRTRKPEDPLPPQTLLGAIGCVISEELYVPVMQSHAQNWSVDGTIGGTLITVYGKELRSGTPYEMLGGALEGYFMKEAVKRAGRPGMLIMIAATAPLEYGQIGATGVPGGPSIDQILVPCLSMSPFKTDYHVLQKVTHSLLNGAAMVSAHYSFVGGYEGTPEGCAVASVAACVLQSIVMRGTTIQSGVQDVRIMGKTTREAIWAQSVGRQAINRNTNILDFYLANPVSGAMTEALLRETTVAVMNGTVSGAAVICGVRTAGGKYPNRTTGLETLYAGEVAKACAGMTREQANEMAKQLFPKYEDELRTPNTGVTFLECFDVKTLKPKKGWEDIYKKVKNEVAKLGFPFPPFE